MTTEVVSQLHKGFLFPAAIPLGSALKGGQPVLQSHVPVNVSIGGAFPLLAAILAAPDSSAAST